MQKTLLALLLLALAVPAQADILVIANRDNPGANPGTREVSDLYLGRSRTLSSGEAVQLLEYRHDHELRTRFYRQLNGMSLPQLNAYWARLQFSGEVLPPPSLPDGQAVLRAVRNNRQALGYIDSTDLDDSVRVVLRLKE